MKLFFLFGALAASGAAWAGDPPAADEAGCEPGYDSMTLADGGSLCVATVPTVCGLSAPSPELPTTVVGPAIAWSDSGGWFGRFWVDTRTALPYGHTVGGFVALVPGLDQSGRYDGQALSVRLDGMQLMSPTDLASLPRLPTRLR